MKGEGSGTLDCDLESSDFFRDCARRRGRLRISSLRSLLSVQGPQVPGPTAYVLGKVLKIKEPGELEWTPL